MRPSLRHLLGYLGLAGLWSLLPGELLPPGLKGMGLVLLGGVWVYALARREERRGEEKESLQEGLLLFQKVTETTPAMILLWQGERLVFANPEALRVMGYPLEELKARPVWDFIHPEDRAWVRARGLARIRGETVPSRYTFRILTKAQEVRWLDYSATRVVFQGQPAVLGIGLDITEEREQQLSLEALARVNEALRSSEDLKEMMAKALEVVLAQVEAQTGSVLLFEPETHRLESVASSGWFQHLPLPQPEGAFWSAVLQGPLFMPNLQEDPRTPPEARPQIPPGWSGAFYPLKAGPATVGLLGLAWPPGRPPSPRTLERAQLMAEALGGSLHRASLRVRLERQVGRLEALRSVDRAIASALDLGTILEILLSQATRLPLDALAVFLWDEKGQGLRLEATRGFRTPGRAWPAYFPLTAESLVGRAALSGRPVHLLDLKEEGGPWGEILRQERLASGRAYPLLAKGRLLGVLAVFTRRPWGLPPEEVAFLEALVSQAAVALDNAQSYQEVLEGRRELALTYELTLWAWAKAVELRDQETGGHTERVVELGLELARALGLKGEELENFRRGAILHDVGKIAIPDPILNKPGPLTEEEWRIMRLHPVYAYEWLKGIPYLRRALEIPYAHHERWDGSGYPRGLKGEDIPLSARIFAVVDVYDALTSDRPYRKAWPIREALAYLEAEAGRSLDPHVVLAFLELLKASPQGDLT